MITSHWNYELCVTFNLIISNNNHFSAYNLLYQSVKLSQLNLKAFHDQGWTSLI